MRTLCFALAWLGLAAPARAQPQWYAADELVDTLRPGERASVARQAQLGAASELPLYDLTVDVADDLRSFTLEETAWITNRTGRPLNEVVFRVFANATGPAGEAPLVTLVSGACLDGLRCAVEASSPSAIVVRPEQPIAPAGRLRIELRLRGRMRALAPERMGMMAQGLESLGSLAGGHGEGDYGLLAYSDYGAQRSDGRPAPAAVRRCRDAVAQRSDACGRVASMAYFFPVLARMRGGRWEAHDASTMGDLGNDELAHVRARVRVSDGVEVAASGIVSGPRAAGARTEHLAVAGFVRDFALVLSPRLVQRERRVGEVVVRSHFVDGHAAAGEQVLDVAAHALRIFTQRFGAYPYTELDVVEAPLVGGAGGVEYSGLVTVATMFYRPASGGPHALLGGVDMEAHRRSALELVTAHEVAHQWWHGLVGSDSRRHPFQDECLAQWSALLYLRERHGAERAQQEADRQVAAGYQMMRLMGREDGAVDRPVAAFGDSLSYAGLVYGKGPFVYRALRTQLGDRAFFAALQGYVRDHRFRTAAPRALFDRMATGRRAAAVRAIERRWLDEAHGDDDLGQPDVGRILGGGAASPDLNDLFRRILGGSVGDQGGSDASRQEIMRGLLEALGGP